MYHQEVVDKLDQLSEQAAKDLVKLTKAKAPVGTRGDFKRHIASKRKEKGRAGSTYVWYVKAPDYRLTHLLVHGHATRNGGRTEPDPFLKNAMTAVIPQFEKDVEEAMKR